MHANRNCRRKARKCLPPADRYRTMVGATRKDTQMGTVGGAGALHLEITNLEHEPIHPDSQCDNIAMTDIDVGIAIGTGRTE